jgi:hypothetical protein
MTKETSTKTYSKQPNIGTSPSEDLADTLSTSTETSIRNTTNNERHTDYESKAANKTFRSSRQDENNSTSYTNNKEDVQPKTPKSKRRTTTFRGGYIQTPEYRRTKGTDPTSSLFPTTGFPGLSLSGSSAKEPKEANINCEEKDKGTNNR